MARRRKAVEESAPPLLGQVHRFHDDVALFLRDGKTQYLSPTKAVEFAEAIRRCAEDCKSRSFLQSTFNTVEIQEEQKSVYQG